MTAVRKIHKKIVINENQEPVEVVIDYADWLEIERLLGLQPTEPPKVDLQKYAGSIRMDLYGDPVEYQRQIRDEWERELPWK